MLSWLKSFLNVGKVKQLKAVVDDREEWGQDHQELIKGSIFYSTLKLSTPLNILELNGTRHPLHYGELPKYCEEKYGCWLPELKTFEDLGSKIKVELPKCMPASDIGPVDPEKYIPFLICCRKIIESKESESSKIKNLIDLKKKNTVFAGFIKKHLENDEDFPISLFYKKFLFIPGIGIKSARSLYMTGVCSLDDLKKLSDKEILKVEGIGKVTLGKIRAHFKS